MHREIHTPKLELGSEKKGDFMRDEYDFSKGERGGFYRPDAKVHLPLYLDDEIQSKLISLAAAKGKDYSEFVNDLLKEILHSQAL
jgi:hypothetical protein